MAKKKRRKNTHNSMFLKQMTAVQSLDHDKNSIVDAKELDDFMIRQLFYIITMQNVEIRDSNQISTTAPIFLLCTYFRHKYLEIASWAVSLLNSIWVRVEHSLLQKLKQIAVQAVHRQNVNKMCGRVEHLPQNWTSNILDDENIS